MCVFKSKAEGEARVLMTKVRVIERDDDDDSVQYIEQKRKNEKG